jgi:ribA/ribD-fused uncharacterized protein
MVVVIDSFSGGNRFLSNFYPSNVVLDEYIYFTVEHAFQAAKTTDSVERMRIRNADTPGKAKRLGRKVTLRPGWDDMRVDVMRGLLGQKFSREPLRSMLRETAPAVLIEGNTWGDRFWGVDGSGLNWLGILLMEIRDEVR